MIQVISHTDNPKLEEMKVVYRRERKKQSLHIRRSHDLVPYLRKIWNDETIDLREELVVICLSTSLEVKGWVRLSEGGFDAANVDTRLLFGILLSTASTAFVLAHNHPSDNPIPSPQDLSVTSIIRDGANLLGLRLLDHIVISRTDYHSMCDNGQLR